MSRYIITVDRAGIDAGNNAPIRVEDVRTGQVAHYSEVVLGTPHATRGRPPVIRYGPARQDGARVWIEADEISGTMRV